jgi:microcystin-dependent protein
MDTTKLAQCLATELSKLTQPTGTIIINASQTAPEGFFECNGAEVSRVDYADLFQAIGETYGQGDGTTTFNLPDLRGEFVRGFDNGRGIDAGRLMGSSQADEMKSHNHAIKGSGHTSGPGSLISFLGLNSGTGYTSTEGGDETRPRNIAMMYCIKY